MANLRVFADNEQDVWIEYPPGSRQLICLNTVIGELIEIGYTLQPMPGIAEQYGPLTELT